MVLKIRWLKASARIMVALGVGPEPIPEKRLTAEKLAAAIHIAVTDPDMQRRPAQLGRRIRTEDGVGNAIQFIETPTCVRVSAS
jgi:sterol 3beta-glucosyltransferase